MSYVSYVKTKRKSNDTEQNLKFGSCEQFPPGLAWGIHKVILGIHWDNTMGFKGEIVDKVRRIDIGQKYYEKNRGGI